MKQTPGNQAPRSRREGGTAPHIDAVERLVRWIRPGTTGRARALATLASVRGVADRQRFRSGLLQLLRELEAVYPSGAIVALARRYVRQMVLALK